MVTVKPSETFALRRHAPWVVGCRIVGIAATLASNILVARLLGPAEFGTYLLVTTVVALGSLVGMAGLNEAGLRLISQSLGLHKTALAWAYARRSIGVAAVASVIAAAAATLCLGCFQFATRHSFGPAMLLALVAAGVALLAWQQLGAELLRAYGKLSLASLFSGGQAGGPITNVLFLGGLSVATVMVTSLNATLVVAISVGSLCVTCPLLCWGLSRVKHHQRGQVAGDHCQLSPQEWNELLAVGGVLLLNQLLAFAMQQLDILLAAGLLTDFDLGLYGAAKRSLLIAAMPVQMAQLTIVSSIPRLFAQARMADLERVIRGAATVAAVPSLIALALLILFPGAILSYFLRESYSQAGSLVIVLAVGHLALTLSGNPQYVLTMTGRHRAVLAVNVISALVLVVAGVIGAVLFGAAGLAAGSAASLIVQNGVQWWFARRELGIWTHVGLRTADPSPSTTAALHETRSRNSRSTEIVPSPPPLQSSSV